MTIDKSRPSLSRVFTRAFQTAVSSASVRHVVLHAHIVSSVISLLKINSILIPNSVNEIEFLF